MLSTRDSISLNLPSCRPILSEPLIFPTPDDFNGIRDNVISLFVQKYHPHQIAELLGLPSTRVNKILKQELGNRLGDRQRMIEIAAMEVDLIMQPIRKRYLEAGEKANREDGKFLLDCHREWKKLVGADAATKVDVSVTSDKSEEEILAELKLQNIDIKMLPAVEDAEFVEKREEVVEGE